MFPVDFSLYTVVVFELSISCEELPVLFGCGGTNLLDSLFEPLPATDNSELYGLAFPPAVVPVQVGLIQC